MGANNTLGINTKIKLESKKSVEERVQKLLGGIKASINVSEIKINDEAVKSQLNELTKMTGKIQENLNNAFSGINISDLERVLILAKELNAYSKGIKINFVGGGNINNTIGGANPNQFHHLKDSLMSEEDLIKRFAKDLGVKYSENFIGAVKDGLKVGNMKGVLKSAFEEIEEATIKHRMKQSRDYAKQSYGDLAERLKGVKINYSEAMFDTREEEMFKMGMKGMTGGLVKSKGKGFSIDSLIHDMEKQFPKQMNPLNEHTASVSLQDKALNLAKLCEDYKRMKSGVAEGVNKDEFMEHAIKHAKRLEESLNTIKGLKSEIGSVKTTGVTDENKKDDDGLKKKTQNLEEFQNKNIEIIDNIKSKFSKIYDNFDNTSHGKGLDAKMNDVLLLDEKSPNLESNKRKIEEYVESMQKELKAREEVQNSIATSSERNKERVRKEELELAKNINKAKQEEYDLTKKLDDLNVKKVVMKNNVSSMAENGHIDESLLSNARNKIDSLGIKSSKEDVKKVEVEVENLIKLEKELKDSIKSGNQERKKAVEEEIKLAKQLDELNAKKVVMRNDINSMAEKGLVDGSLLSNASKQIDGLGVKSSKEAIKQVEVEIKNLIKAEKERENQLKNINKQDEKSLELNSKLKNEIESFKSIMNGKMNNFSSKYAGMFDEGQLAKLKRDVNSFNPKSLNECASATKVFNSQFKILESTAKGVKHEMDAVNSSSGSFLKTLGETSAQFGLWYGIGGVIQGVFSAFKNGIHDVVELDSQITNMKITMNGTDQQFAYMTDSAQKMADTLGSTVTDVMNVATVYANASESVQSILDKTKADVILSNVSKMDSKATTDSLQAIMNQFKMEGGDVEKTTMGISDTLVGLSKQMKMDFSRGIQEVTDGVKVCGSIAKQSGLDLQEFSAMVGTVAETTRLGGRQIGNAFKSIFSNMNSMKTGKGDKEKLTKVQRTLRGVGIELKDQQGHLRKTDTIIDEIGKKWKNLSKEQKIAIGDDIAGKYHKNVFNGLMEGYDRYKKLLNSATNSEGESEKANDKYLQSAEAKIKKLENAMTTFWQKTLNSNEVKGFIDLLTSLVQGITSVVQHFGAIPTIIFAISTAMLTMNKNWRNFIKTVIATKDVDRSLATLRGQVLHTTKTFEVQGKVVNATIRKTTKELPKLGNMYMNQARQLHNLKRVGSGTFKIISSSVNKATSITGAFSKSLIGLVKCLKDVQWGAIAVEGALTMGLSVAISGVIWLFEKLVGASSEAKDKIDELANSMPQKNEDYRTQNAMINEMEELDKKVGKTTEDKQRLTEIQHELAQAFPEAIDGFDKEGKAIIKNVKGVKELIKQKKKLLDLENKEVSDKAEKELPKVEKEIKQLETSIDNKQKLLRENKNEYINASSKNSSSNGLGYDLKKRSDIEKEISEDIALLKKKNLEQAKYKTVLTQERLDRVQDIQLAIQQNKLKVEDNKAKEESINKLKEMGYAEEDIRSAIDETTQAKNDAIQTTEQLSASTEQCAITTQNAQDMFSQATQNIDFYNKALAELDRNGNISAGTVTQILKKHQELVGSLGNEVEMRNKLMESMKKEQQTQADAYRQMLMDSQEFYNAKIKCNDEAQRQILESVNEMTRQLGFVYDADLKNFQTMSELKLDVANKCNSAILESSKSAMQSMSNLISYSTNSLAFGSDLASSIMGTADTSKMNPFEKHQYEHMNEIKGNEIRDAKKGIQDKLNSLMDAHLPKSDFTPINNIGGGFKPKSHGVGKGKHGKNGSGSKVADLKLEIDRYLNLKGVLDDVNTEIQRNNNLVAKSKGAEKNKLIEKGIELLKKKKKALQDLYDEENKEASELKEKLTKQGFTITSDGLISNYKEKMLRLQGWANSSSGEDKTKRIEQVRDMDKDIKRFMSLWHKDMAQIGTEIANMSNELKKAYENQLSVIQDVQGKISEVIKKQKEERLKAIDEEKDAKLKALQEVQDAYNKDNNEEDYQESLRKENKKLNEIRKLMTDASRDLSLEGKARLDDLKRQFNDQQENINRMIKEHQRQENNDRYEKEKQQIEDDSEKTKKDIDKKWSDVKINEMSNQAVKNGFFQNIDGKIVDVKQAYVDFENRFGQGMTILGDKIKTEFISNLEVAQKSMKDLVNLEKELNITVNGGMANTSSVVDIPKNIIKRYSQDIAQIQSNNLASATRFDYSLSSQDIPPITPNKSEVNVRFDKPLIEIQGNATKDILPQLKEMCSKLKEDIVGKFKNELQLNGVY